MATADNAGVNHAVAIPQPLVTTTAATTVSTATTTATREVVDESVLAIWAPGAVSGMTKMLVGHPFDTVKVRMQALSARQAAFANPMSTLRATVRNEGFLALFKGLTPNIPCTMYYNMVNIGVFRFMCDRFERDRGLDGGSEQRLPLGDIALAGMVAGVAHLPVTNALELVRVRCQIQHSSRRLLMTPLEAMQRAIRHDGYGKGLSKGIGFTAIREIPGNAVYFATYETCFRSLCAGRDQASAQDLSQFAFISGGLAGVLNWACLFPVDSLKSRYQSDSLSRPKFRSPWHCVQKSLKHGGLVSLFRGLSPCLVRAFLANGTGFATIELVNRAVHSFKMTNQHDTSMHA